MGHNSTGRGILQPRLKSSKKLGWVNIVSNKIELLHQALYTFKENGDLEQTIVNWNALAEIQANMGKGKGTIQQGVCWPWE